MTAFLKAKNTGVGAVDLWNGNHTRFHDQEDIPSHFKAMVWKWNLEKGVSAKEKTMKIFCEKGYHYVDIGKGIKGGTSTHREKQCSKVKVDDIIHMYSKKSSGSGIHIKGVVVEPYTLISVEDFRADFPHTVNEPVHTFLNGKEKTATWLRCKIKWEPVVNLTSEWMNILTQPGCGTIIPLKIPY